MKDFYITSMFQGEIYFDLEWELVDDVFDFCSGLERESKDKGVEIEVTYCSASPCSYPRIEARCLKRKPLEDFLRRAAFRIKQHGGTFNP